jgi:DNA polymerase I-like protein with 3'-5' exonuclease and polymerase domains
MWFLPVMHPAYTFRQPEGLGPLTAHFEGFVRRLLVGFPDPPLLLSDPPVERLKWMVAECKRRRIGLAVDIEARPPDRGPKEWALLPRWTKLRAFGVGIDIKHVDSRGKKHHGIGLSWYFPAHPLIWGEFKRAMADPGLVKVFCNGWMFDIPALERHGCPVRGPIEDIREGRRALVSTSRTSLGFQAGIYTLCSAWKAEALEDENDQKGYVDASRIPRKRLTKYNAEDCVRTAQVRSCHVREFKEDPHDYDRKRKLYLQQKRLAVVGAEMSLKGFPVDNRKRLQLSKELTRIATERARKFQQLTRKYGDIRINIGKSYVGVGDRESGGGVNQHDFAALIFREARKPGIKSFSLEVPFAEASRTDTGKPSVNKLALLYLFSMPNLPEELKAIIYAYWQVNAPLKARNTFVDSKIVLTRIGPDGRMHAGINTCGAETGRWSCSDPNLFNLSESKAEEEGALTGDLPNVRAMYCAPEGFVVCHRDYKSFEVEIMEHYTGDLPLRHMLDSGDPHTARARLWFADIIPLDAPVPRGMRKQAKIVGLQSQYHAGAESVYMKVLEQIQDARFEEVAALHAKFPETHPGIAAHWESSLEFAKMNGYNETGIMRRRRYYPPSFHIKDTETSNYAIQGTAGDIANSALVGTHPNNAKDFLFERLKREHPKAWLAMHTYDSFDVIAPRKEAEAVLKLMDECMSGAPLGGWEVKGRKRLYKTDEKFGQSWGDV